MDPSAQYQQQQQHQVVDPQSYDPSKYQQAYDPSAQAYYAQYHAQYQQEYAAYYSQYYANSQYPQQQEPASIHPPGVPIPSQTATHLPGSEQSYYPQPLAGSDPTTHQAAYHGGGFGGAVPVQGGARPPIGHSTYRGGGRRGTRPYRGGARGHFGTRSDASGSQGGRGRGRGRGANNSTSAPAQGQWPPPRMAWCELCRVDCNTHEILEQHRNGKRHKKNLQVYEELQKLNKILVEGLKEPEPNNGTDGTVQEPNPEKAPDEAGTAEPRVCGTKRKMKVGRGGKRMRRTDESPRPEAVPLICELCNVKCDSKVVFDTHLMGKKHVLNMKKFQGHQNMLGQAALQALYPALEALYPALQALCQPNAAAIASSSAFSLQVHGPQEYGAPAGSVAGLESAPLAVLESVGEDSKTEGGGTQKDVIEEGENQQQPAKENLESGQIASVDTNNENGNAELGKKDVVDLQPGNAELGKKDVVDLQPGNAELGKKDVDLQVDDSVVAPPSESPGTEA